MGPQDMFWWQLGAVVLYAACVAGCYAYLRTQKPVRVSRAEWYSWPSRAFTGIEALVAGVVAFWVAVAVGFVVFVAVMVVT